MLEIRARLIRYFPRKSAVLRLRRTRRPRGSEPSSLAPQLAPLLIRHLPLCAFFVSPCSAPVHARVPVHLHGILALGPAGAARLHVPGFCGPPGSMSTDRRADTSQRQDSAARGWGLSPSPPSPPSTPALPPSLPPSPPPSLSPFLSLSRRAWGLVLAATLDRRGSIAQRAEARLRLLRLLHSFLQHHSPHLFEKKILVGKQHNLRAVPNQIPSLESGVQLLYHENGKYKSVFLDVLREVENARSRIADPTSSLSRQLALVSARTASMGSAAAGPKPGELSVGTTVEIHSLLRAPELNGVRGKVVGPTSQDPGTGRWSVKIEREGRLVALKSSNLRLVSTPSLRGARPAGRGSERLRFKLKV